MENCNFDMINIDRVFIYSFDIIQLNRNALVDIIYLNI